MDRPLPQAIETEKAVLGALMIDPEAYMRISGLLDVQSFYQKSHQLIFQAIKTLTDKGADFDLVTITQYLISQGKIDEAGGAFYLTQLAGAVMSSFYIEQHARIIQQKQIRRDLIKSAYEIQERAYDEAEDDENLIAWSQDKLENVTKNVSEGKTNTEVTKTTIRLIEENCANAASGELSGIPTGLSAMNRLIGGWKAPYFVVMGARPAVGKTTLAINFAVAAAKAGYKPHVYNYEMAATDLMKIIVSGQSHVNRTKIRDGLLEDQDWYQINKHLDSVLELPITWFDDPDIRASQIRANTYKGIKSGTCDIVIIDYIQLMPPENKKLTREQQISEISRILKRMTAKLGIPVVALAQLNRDVEKRNDPETYPSDLRESGSLEQDADIILLPYNILGENGEIEERVLKVAKNRHGQTGKIRFVANSDMTRIQDYQGEFTPISAGSFTSPQMPVNENFENEDIPF